MRTTARTRIRAARGASVVLLAVCLGSTPRARPQDEANAGPRVTQRDQEALQGFDFFIGTWTPPGDDPEAGFEFSWGLEGKTVHVRELRRIDGRLQPISEALVGWHYGEDALVFHEFVLDGLKPFEVMYAGRMRFEPENVLVREFHAFDPDGTSRAYRERFVPDGPDAWTHDIEYQDDDGSWKHWGRFKGIRR